MRRTMLVQAVEGFIQNQHRGALHDGLRNTKPLPHTERVFRDSFFSPGSKPTRRIDAMTSFSPIIFLSEARSIRFFTPVRFGRKPGVSMMMPKSGGKSTSFPTVLPFTMIVPESGVKATNTFHHNSFAAAVVADNTMNFPCSNL